MLRNALFAVTVGTLATAGAAKAQESAAAKAIEAAKQFGGSEITVVAEAGLQALLDKQYTGPEWEKLTGIKVNVVEANFEEIYPKTILERQAGTGAFDVLLISPAWLADFVANDAVDSARPLHRKVRRQVRVRRHQSGIQGLDVLSGQDLRSRGGRRRPRDLLSQGPVRGP